MINIIYKGDNSYVVLVGVNSGIGQVLCQQLLNSNSTVFGIDIQENSQVEPSKRYTYFQASPLSEADMKYVIQQIEKTVSYIDGLVNLSGTINNFKSIEETSFDEWNETYDISFKSCFNSCKLFSSLLKNTGNAAIVNMSSGLAFSGREKYGAYATAKNAVVSFSRTLATELAPTIRVNTVAPGAVDTNFIYQEDGTMRFDKNVYENMVPLGSIAKPKEISHLILFLLSEEASHITGQCIHVNGGALMS